ncbi:AAA family ATPase [Neobacillus sp. LXY-4]|uniref:AAA family ATPase n=1 Tax=Neobacillus sp. LXY-4 TaxID=3379826 RepID=UPI003EE09B64
MKIKEMILENFRGFKHLHLHFNEKNVVLVGTNGVGKSTILNAAIILLSRIVESLSYGVSKKISLSESDIKNGNQGLRLKCTLHYNGFERELALIKTRAKDINSRSKLTVYDSTKDMITYLHANLKDGGDFNAPIFVNYPVHRNVKDIPSKIKKRKSSDPFSPYHQCFSNDVEFRSFFEWYLIQEDIEHREQVASKVADYEDKQLKAVRNAIYNFMPGFSDLKVARVGGKVRMVISKGSQRLGVNQLSNGEKCTLAMIGDLARRLVLANPSLENPLEGEGIVLVDEIELHLHPALQRDIINRLQTTFPHIQFFISTHSPQVLGEVNDAKIFFVTQKEDGEDIFVRSGPCLFGKDSNMILEQFMGAPEKNEEIKEQLGTLFQLLMETRLDEANDLMVHLVEILGSDDPSLIKADMILRRKKSLGL